MGRLISNVIFTAHKPSQCGSSEETDVQAGFGSMDSVRRPTHGSVRCGDRRASIVICNHAHALCEQLLLLLLRSPAEQCGVTRYVQFALTNAFPTLRGWCVTVLFLFCFSTYFYLFYLHFLYYPATQAATGHLRRICSPFWREDAVTRGVNRG